MIVNKPWTKEELDILNSFLEPYIEAAKKETPEVQSQMLSSLLKSLDEEFARMENDRT